MKVIKNIDDLCELFGLERLEGPERLKKAIYKYTDCGAWVEFLPENKGIKMGSIVEGSDVEIPGRDLLFPFTEDDWDEFVGTLEEEADHEWRMANEDIWTP